MRVVRRAAAEDAAALAGLAAQSFAVKFGDLYPPDVLAAFLAERYSVPQTLALIGNPALAVWVVNDGGLQAYAVLGPCKLPHTGVTAGCVELQRLYTAPEATGMRLGSLLINQARLSLVDRGSTSINNRERTFQQVRLTGQVISTNNVSEILIRFVTEPDGSYLPISVTAVTPIRMETYDRIELMGSHE